MTETTAAPTPKKSGLELLREPFPANLISKLPKPTKKDNPKGKCAECGGYHGLPAVHLDYVGHAALTHRLLDADPAWSWEPLASDGQGLPLFDEHGGLWIKLTVCGVTRLGYGQAEPKPYADIGAREKEVIGDCLRNAAMRFGAALELWSKADLHAGDEPDIKDADPKKEEPKRYPDADFVKNFKTWEGVIAGGKKTATDMIAMIETKGALSADQKAKLKAIKRVRTKADVEAAMKGATDAEELAFVVSTQVVDVQDDAEKKALMTLAEELENSLLAAQS